MATEAQQTLDDLMAEYKRLMDTNGGYFGNNLQKAQALIPQMEKQKNTIAQLQAAVKDLKNGKNISEVEASIANLLSTKQFKAGGLINFTGPAWVDGTKGSPEYILNAQQTEGFFTLVDAMDKLMRIGVPGLSASAPTFNNGSSNNTFGDIIINVESLDSDTDIDNMAERVMEAIDDRMNRGAVVGGIRMGF